MCRPEPGEILLNLPEFGGPTLRGLFSAGFCQLGQDHPSAIAREKGWKQATPIDAETIIALAPEVILVEDFKGMGTKPFQPIPSNPAPAEIPAIRGK